MEQTSTGVLPENSLPGKRPGGQTEEPCRPVSELLTQKLWQGQEHLCSAVVKQGKVTVVLEVDVAEAWQPHVARQPKGSSSKGGNVVALLSGTGPCSQLGVDCAHHLDGTQAKERSGLHPKDVDVLC